MGNVNGKIVTGKRVTGKIVTGKRVKGKRVKSTFIRQKTVIGSYKQYCPESQNYRPEY